MALFAAAELAALLQRPVSDDTFRIAYDLTEDAILAEVGNRLTDPPQPGVKSVALSVAARALTNPSGLGAESAGSISVTYVGALAGITLSKAELRRLRKAVGLGPRASSLDIGPPYIALGPQANFWFTREG